MLHTETVPASRLEIGDELISTEGEPSGVYVSDVWADDSGTWVEFSDGDCGYLSGRFKVQREYAEL